MNDVICAMQSTLQKCGLLNRAAKMVCAVSGGADSVALLRALCLLRYDVGFTLKAVHVQHGLRGEASLQDEAYVRKICEDWNVPLIVRKADLCGSMDTPGMETLAREARYRIFAQELAGADALLLAHHRDDQAETVLMHLLRGSGLEGLCGMKPATAFGGGLLVRPFLNVAKSVLMDWLHSQNITWRTDESNTRSCTLRNALRLNILPQLEKMAPGAGQHMASSAELLAADTEYLHLQADDLFRDAAILLPGLFALQRSKLAKQPYALLSRVVRQFYTKALQIMGVSPDEKNLNLPDTRALCALAQGSGTAVNLPFHLKVVSGRYLLSICTQDDEPIIDADPLEICLQNVQGGYRGLDFCRRIAVEKPDSPFTAFFSKDILEKNPVLRYPQKDDRITPIGAPGQKELRRYFTDIKLDASLRSVWPVVAVENTVLWIPGLCTSQQLRIDTLTADMTEIAVCDGTLAKLIAEKER